MWLQCCAVGATTTGTSNDAAGVTQGGGASDSTATADGNVGSSDLSTNVTGEC